MSRTASTFLRVRWLVPQEQALSDRLSNRQPISRQAVGPTVPTQQPVGRKSVTELHARAQTLITHQYGNYVIQHVIEHAKIQELVTTQLLAFSTHKFGSIVVQKAIRFGSNQQRQAITSGLTATPSDESTLQLVMKDQYGNYVICKPSTSCRFCTLWTNSNFLHEELLARLKGVEREWFVEDVRSELIILKEYSKQIIALEKLISIG